MNKPFLSICIPTWEIKGNGVNYLDYSLNILAHQTFKDFEIIISDHSTDNEIKNYLESWKEYLNIKYILCETGRGLISPNLNNGLRHCSGEYIKILFQDDFLYEVDSLQKIVNQLQNKNVKWLVTGCAHTKDMETIYDMMIPYYHDKIYQGINTISCPSVLTIKNDKDLILFDEDLNWLVDVDYYKKCYDKFGLPIIEPTICVINRQAEIRTTNLIQEERKQKELSLMLTRYQKSLHLPNVTLLAMTSVRLEEHIKALEYSSKNIKFGAIKLISDIKPPLLPNNITYEYIEPMKNIDDWNYSMIYKLGKYVDTEYVLIIHDDGFIINPDSWRNEFFNYDYIGAPWPIPSDNYSYRDINGELIRVGNSVSLRSKKLIDLPVKLNLEWKPFHGYYSEDGFLTVNYRHIFKEHGCVYADIDVAKYFSHETPLPETQGITPFAFHGKNSPYKNLIK